jgi:hypothetical protein
MLKYLMMMNEEAGDGANNGGGVAAGGSALSNFAGQPEPAADPNDWLPEKFRVKGDGDALDITASSRKLAEAYKHAEGRLGTGDAPPKTAEEYEVKLESDVIKWDEFKADETNKAFLKAAHAKGMTNAQLEFVLSEYAQRAPALAQGAAQLDTESTLATMRETWGADTDKQMGLAVKAALAAGFTNDDLGGAEFNSPALIKMAAFFGAQMGEDQPPSGGGVSAESVEDLMRSPAYGDPKHPDYNRVNRQVQAHFERQFKG